jgi:hypothetical protein
MENFRYFIVSWFVVVQKGTMKANCIYIPSVFLFRSFPFIYGVCFLREYVAHTMLYMSNSLFICRNKRPALHTMVDHIFLSLDITQVVNIPKKTVACWAYITLCGRCVCVCVYVHMNFCFPAFRLG